jgi:hypothetical protein
MGVDRGPGDSRQLGECIKRESLKGAQTRFNLLRLTPMMTNGD